VVHLLKLHPFPSEKDSFGGSDKKKREYKQKTLTFNLNCSDYCTHEKLQEWPPLPIPQKKVNFSKDGRFFRGYWREEYSFAPPPKKYVKKNGVSLFSSFWVLGGLWGS